MRRAKLSLAVALALALSVAGAVAATDFVTNGQFNQELAATWSVWEVDCNSFTSTWSALPNYATIDIVQGRNAEDTNPALKWYRWDTVGADSDRAICASQNVGGPGGISLCGYSSLLFKADITLEWKSWSPARSDWNPGFMGVIYTDGGADTFALNRFDYTVIPGVTWLNRNQTYPQTWDLKSMLPSTAVVKSIFIGGQGAYFQGEADNVQLLGTAVPEPAGLSALIVALSGATGLIMRRRRS